MCIKEIVTVENGCTTHLHENLSMHMLNQSSAVFDLLNESYYTNYKSVFNTPYMEIVMRYFAEKSTSEFSIPSDILGNSRHNQRNTTAATEAEAEAETITTPEAEKSGATLCSCCLCQLRVKNGQSHKFCIKKHPLEASCHRNKPNKKSTQLKYCEQTVCDECMLSMTLVSKKSRTKKYCCIFGSCKVELNLSAMRTHLMKHLKSKQFVCTICDKGYSSKSGLRNHERKH